jgi:serine/threonine-protein kinase
MMAASCNSCGAVAEAGGFRIERVVVQNGHGRMYLARDAAGVPVALKELAFVQAPHPDAVEAFEREARLLRQLSHPQIPRFLASFREGDGVNTRLYLAQEYVEGESLQARLQSHQFSEAEARDVALQVLSILAYLQGLAPMVFHRDIKPANLIRRVDGRIALVDFGAARDLGPTVGATLVGTFGYMPVEQLGGIVDATTDLYGLGATLCHLLSRRPPWSFIEDPRALSKLNVSPAFRDFLGRLTARQREDRFPSPAAAGQGLLAPRRRLSLPAPRVQVMAVVALVFGFTLGAATYLVQPRTRRARIERIPVRGEEGRRPLDNAVWLDVCTDTEGRVTSVTLADGRTSPQRDEIVAQVKRLQFERVMLEGRPVPHCRRVKYIDRVGRGKVVDEVRPILE